MKRLKPRLTALTNYGHIPQSPDHPGHQTRKPQARKQHSRHSQRTGCQHGLPSPQDGQGFRRRNRAHVLRQHRKVLTQVQPRYAGRRPLPDEHGSPSGRGGREQPIRQRFLASMGPRHAKKLKEGPLPKQVKVTRVGVSGAREPIAWFSTSHPAIVNSRQASLIVGDGAGQRSSFLRTRRE